ncbi:ankyrin repeat protein, putative [Trichomonas vaginalis G3]|uniref:Ankyrin repeat protein, putative n=1 Tax=Trichomonas vaginalis (strain ATCC PRA-98 / G3) TaxID=412133 RepID=A2E1D5_TRIV3|nr:ankyrin repeat and SOCS box-containing protein 4 family [Trichomonas vaginalis G3]EAY13502.1 ankyrin repeat protein, putative [Trichomonas vaginalis G3]KAI5529234.1 ankyrin repeat and SOCS box-containing protein 4 family [Trichomonas vaginalis G3]|eukprot:XP_001325725.1 ankyrin repeat protein [Trichomonas vaginalis G3]
MIMWDYNELAEICKDYNDATLALYKLRASNEEAINEVYKDIKSKLIETKILSPSQICCEISKISFYNNAYFRSYLSLFKKIFEEYHLNQLPGVEGVFAHILNQEYEISLPPSINGHFFYYSDKEYSLKNYLEHPINKAIMNDDVESFISYAGKEKFRIDHSSVGDFYPDSYLDLSWLELCCYHGAGKCFKFLISKFKPEITQKCLSFTFLGGNAEIMNECLKEQDPDEDCMKYAIIAHNIDFITFLAYEYDEVIDPEYCCEEHNIQAFLVYLDISKNINQCLIYSTRFNFPPLCQYLIDHGADINSIDRDGKTALHHAAENSCVEIAKLLISKGIDIKARNHNGKTALHSAANRNNKEILEYLITHGIDINARDNEGKSTLHYATSKSLLSIFEALISHGADINAKDNDGQSVLHDATKSYNTNVIETLVSYGVDMNAKDLHGMTPLLTAAKNNSLDVMKTLIKNGADIHAKNNEGQTALHLVAHNHNFDNIVEFLISNGADINTKNIKGLTPLHYAAEDGDKELVELLLKHGADIHVKDMKNQSILHFAAWNFNTEVAKALISHGADINSKDNDGILPYQIAKELENDEVAKLLSPVGTNFKKKVPRKRCKTSVNDFEDLDNFEMI